MFRRGSLAALVLALALLAGPAWATINTTRADLIGTWKEFRLSGTGPRLFRFNGDGTGIYQNENITWTYANPRINIFNPGRNRSIVFTIWSESHARMVVSCPDGSLTAYKILKLDTAVDTRANFSAEDLVDSWEYTNSSGTKIQYTFYTGGYGLERSGTSSNDSGRTFIWSYNNPRLILTGSNIQLAGPHELEPATLGSRYYYNVILYADGYLTLIKDGGTLLILKQK